ncbi:MAG: endonuclease/exonuclease/phosphatase family protein [Candidatus Bathyarchaeota archaeon]|jgi:endonuclease/exonuclease/phosphatase family metal-dependent hydrolase|nr:endonuclease/exonuclease/phosphatase family protein [Candidatus Bathyarchaeota archaeon]
MKKISALALILIGVGAAVSLYLTSVPRIGPSEQESSKVTIAAFNVQVLGRSKRQKNDVMEVLVLITREFDVVLIQEIRDSSEETIPYLLNEINEIEGAKYGFVRSERLGRTISKEAYAYLYNTETVEFIEGSDYVYSDVDDVFEREPYIASFRSGSFDFTLVGIHTKPDDARSEIGNLTNVVSSVLSKDATEKDIIVLGDFNADGRYFNESDPTSPFKTSEYYWVITNDMDTMIKTDYTYDRIVLMNATFRYEYLEESAAVFHFDMKYAISNATLVEEVSDHYPIYAEFSTDPPDDD